MSRRRDDNRFKQMYKAIEREKTFDVAKKYRDGIALMEQVRARNGQLYDKFKVSCYRRYREYVMNDLHAYVKHIATYRKQDVYKMVSNIDKIDPVDVEIITSTRGLEWFHIICLDLMRYLLRDRYEDVSKIPLHSPLRSVILDAHEEQIPYVAYWPSADDYLDPIIERMVEDKEDDKGKMRYEVPEDAGIPKLDGFTNVHGFMIVVDPRCKLLYFGLPRGRLKSTLMSAVQAWYAERNPDKQQYLACWNKIKVRDHMDDIKKILEKQFGRDVFSDKHPATKSDVESWTKMDMSLVGDHVLNVSGNQIVGRSIMQDPTGSHPDILCWDDVEVNESLKGDYISVINQKFVEQFNNLLNPGGVGIVTGTLYSQIGPHTQMIRREIASECNLILASWCDNNIDEAYGVGKTISRRWPQKYMISRLADMPPDEFARNHELRNVSSEEMMFDPKRFLPKQLRKGTMYLDIQKGFDRIVIVTDTTKTDGTGKGADFMAGVAMGVKRASDPAKSDKVYLIGIYHTRAKTNRKGFIYSKFLQRILHMCNPKYGGWNVCPSRQGTPDSKIFDYIEKDGESDMSLANYKRLSNAIMDGNISDEEYVEIIGSDHEIEENLSINFSDVPDHYRPRLIPVSVRGRKKSDRIASAGEIWKELAIQGCFITWEEFTFAYSAKYGKINRKMNQINELKREMISYVPGGRSHDDMLDSIAHALELLNPKLCYRTRQEGDNENNRFKDNPTSIKEVVDDFGYNQNTVKRKDNIKRLYDETPANSRNRGSKSSIDDFF